MSGYFRKIEQITRELLKEENNEKGNTNLNILEGSVIIGFTPKQIEKRTLSSLLEDNEESMWDKLLNIQANNHM